MKPKLEYTVVHERPDAARFEDDVRAMIALGWEPLGGVSFNKVHGYEHYWFKAQAMIRRTHKPWWRFWK